MINRVLSLALIASLSGSLAFAGDKTKTKSSAEGVSASTAETTSAQTRQTNVNPRSPKKTQKLDRNHAKPAVPDQDEQFNKVLQGIYG